MKLTSLISLGVWLAWLAGSDHSLWAATESGKLGKLEMLLKSEFHANEGCLSDSLCTKANGEDRKRWLVFIDSLEKKNSKLTEEAKAKSLETYREKYGLPTGLWLKNFNTKNAKAFSPIRWDSQCRHHQHKNPERVISMGLAFIAETKNKKMTVVESQKKVVVPFGDGKNIFLDTLIVQQDHPKNQSQVKYFSIPQGEVPLTLENEKLQLVRDADGFYYSLLISTQGDWKVVPLFKNMVEVQNDEVDCPPILAKIFHEEINSQGLYASSYCKKISDRVKKKDYTMLIPVSCQ